MLFLTGSIGYAMRGAYDWMLGIKALPDGLAIDPCIPAAFDRVGASFAYLGKKVELAICNPEGRQAGVTAMTLNGRRISSTRIDPCSGRRLFVAADRLFRKPVNQLVATL
jgi:cellobiose phosphorylase